MCLAFYSAKSDNEGRRLLAGIKGQTSVQKIRVLRSIETLENAVAGSVSPDIAILMAADPEELKSLAVLKNRLVDSRVIMILPDRSEESLRSARPFGALLTCFRDDDFSEAMAVLNRVSNAELAESTDGNPKIFWWAQGLPYAPLP